MSFDEYSDVIPASHPASHPSEAVSQRPLCGRRGHARRFAMWKKAHYVEKAKRFSVDSLRGASYKGVVADGGDNRKG